MRKIVLSSLTVAALVTLGACGQSEQADTSEIPPIVEQTPVLEADPEPKFIGAPSPRWQMAGDAVRDDTLVRDVTFATEGRGATVEVVFRPTDATVRVQLLNNEGVVLSETTAAPGSETRLIGQATAGDRNMVRIIRETRTSVPTPFSVRIRTIPEPN